MNEQLNSRKERMIELRKQGLTYEEIAAEVGISRQRVYQIIGGSYRRHKAYAEEDCVYTGLRNWLNEHDVGVAQFVRSMYGEYNPTVHQRVTRIMRGKDCRKSFIDRVLMATGLTYEQAFRDKEDSND